MFSMLRVNGNADIFQLILNTKYFLLVIKFIDDLECKSFFLQYPSKTQEKHCKAVRIASLLLFTFLFNSIENFFICFI